MEKNTYKILWVDDDVYEIEYLLYPLEKDGYRIEKLANLSDAYNTLVKNRNFDLIVLDLLMPITDRFGDVPMWLDGEHANGANGMKLLVALREKLNIQIPVLILSVVPDAINEMNISDRYDPLDFIHKSSHQVEDAVSKIREMLEQKDNK